ncbi:GGDEF domain-containing protein [Paraglaciecola sp.]|uniref:GGDEF domain-containing protein n=1 Tax=Paraglaciecola sp. TaxID=1920173 RepID=UPI003EFA688E
MKKVLSFSKVEIALSALACLSIILLLIPADSLTKTQTIYTKDYQAIVFADTVEGGQSNITWRDQAQNSWTCHLKDIAPNPFCSWQLTTVNAKGEGLDLSSFKQITLYGNTEGPSEFFRLYLRNRNHEYYKFGETNTTKYNSAELPVAKLSNGEPLNLKDMTVADWWLSANKISPELSHPEFNDVVFIEIQNGTLFREGVQEFQLEKIELSGPIISQEQLYKILIIIWIVSILSLLLFRVIILNRTLKSNLAYQKELVSINKLLNLENQKFEDLAKTDQLTGLLNRLGIRDVLYEGLTSWKRNKKPFSFVLLDVDHFKKLNDTFGHDIGDLVLKSLAQLLSDNIRPSDYLARWGGEEFILVCPNTDLVQAKQIAELLRSKVEKMELAQTGPITTSFGVATMATPDLDVLFKSADKALYQA